MPEPELRHLFAALDVDRTGCVDAQEFLAGVFGAVVSPDAERNALAASFRHLDRCAATRRVCGCGGMPLTIYLPLALLLILLFLLLFLIIISPPGIARVT